MFASLLFGSLVSGLFDPILVSEFFHWRGLFLIATLTFHIRLQSILCSHTPLRFAVPSWKLIYTGTKCRLVGEFDKTAASSLPGMGLCVVLT